MKKIKKANKASTSYRILLIEDGSADQVALSPLVREEGAPYDFALARSISDAKKILTSERFDAVITGYHFGDGTVFDIFEILTDTPIIIVTALNDTDSRIVATGLMIWGTIFLGSYIAGLVFMFQLRRNAKRSASDQA